MPEDIGGDYRALNGRVDSILATFDLQLAALLAKAQIRTSLKMRRLLTVEDDGTIRPTVANIKALRQLPKLFRDSLSAEGYDGLVTGFLASFNGGLPRMEKILGKIAKAYALVPPTFTAADKAFFDALKQNTALNLEAAIDLVSQSARQSTMFSVGGTSYEEMAVQLAGKLHIALGQAESVAVTGISTFYRTIAAQGFQQIEESGKPLAYTYYGPLDVLNRPLCRELEEAARSGKTWTKVEIDRMNNGQIPDVFTTCGGYRCRHQWIVALDKGKPLW